MFNADADEKSQEGMQYDPVTKAISATEFDTNFWGAVTQLPAGTEVQAVLVKLGVETPEDLAYVTEEDLVAHGVPVIAARKLLAANATSAVTSAAPSTPAATTASQPATFSSEDTMKALAKKGVLCAERTDGQIFCSSFLGGALLGWGCSLTTVVAGGSAVFLQEAPGLLALLTGAVFPAGLSMVLLSGSELLTGNFMTMALPAWTHSRISKQQVVSNLCRIWSISGLGNLAGSLFLAGNIYALSVVTAGSPAAMWLAALTAKKCALPYLTMIGKGACANWLVNVAIFQASSAHTTAGKIASLWIPIMTFVALGLEHSIANMFLLPLGMMLGADVGTLDIVGNLLPVAFGNAIGAIVFVAGIQRYSLLRNFVYSKNR